MAVNRIAADYAQAEASSGFVACPAMLLMGLSQAKHLEIQQIYELALERAVAQAAAPSSSPWRYPMGFSNN